MKKRYHPLCYALLSIALFWTGFRCAASLENKLAAVIFPDGRELSVEVADTEESRRLGLMFREKLEWDEGMLLVFEKDDFHSIWMKNCKIPLDIIWLSRDGKIVHMKKSAQPCPANEDCPSFAPFRKSRYVLEVRAGTVLKHSLKNGDEIILLGMSDRIK